MCTLPVTQLISKIYSEERSAPVFRTSMYVIYIEQIVNVHPDRHYVEP